MENFLEGFPDGREVTLAHGIDSTSDRQEILKILLESKETGKSIGISSPLTGEGFVITAVDDIVLVEGETVITVRPYDVTGFMLPVTQLPMSKIHAVCPLRSKFGNPVLRNIEKGKSWFF